MPDTIANLRRDYALEALTETDVHEDPTVQFARWFEEALNANVSEPNAFVLATATPEGRPSARVMLLKGLDARGFTFFTNYESRKGREILANPWVAMDFFWDELERQVRVEGRAEKVPAEESDAYFASRPHGSRLGAWASSQSSRITSREELEERLREVEARFGGGEVPRPPHWGGFLVAPVRIEFWQGRPSRLHDRILYELDESGWSVSRLSP